MQYFKKCNTVNNVIKAIMTGHNVVLYNKRDIV